jgi:hypothetical protein
LQYGLEETMIIDVEAIQELYRFSPPLSTPEGDRSGGAAVAAAAAAVAAVAAVNNNNAANVNANAGPLPPPQHQQ